MPLYAWIDENGTLCATYDLEFVPEKYKKECKVFEELSISDADKLYKDENGEIQVKSQEMLLEEEKKKALEEIKQRAKAFFDATDWVLIKALELEKRPEELYPETMAKRAQVRSMLFVTKEGIRQATSIEKVKNFVNNFIVPSL